MLRFAWIAAAVAAGSNAWAQMEAQTPIKPDAWEPAGAAAMSSL